MARETKEEALKRLLPEVIEELGGDKLLLSMPHFIRISQFRNRVIVKLFMEKTKTARGRKMNIQYFVKTSLNAFNRMVGENGS